MIICVLKLRWLVCSQNWKWPLCDLSVQCMFCLALQVTYSCLYEIWPLCTWLLYSLGDPVTPETEEDQMCHWKEGGVKNLCLVEIWWVYYRMKPGFLLTGIYITYSWNSSRWVRKMFLPSVLNCFLSAPGRKYFTTSLYVKNACTWITAGAE